VLLPEIWSGHIKVALARLQMPNHCVDMLMELLKYVEHCDDLFLRAIMKDPTHKVCVYDLECL